MTSNHRICIVGSGLSGICAAIKVKKQWPNEDVVIFERHSGVGGVWCENTYPGCGVDIPGHLYSFSFSPKSDWERVYPKQEEILNYIETITDEFGIRDLVRFGTLVESISWNEENHKWLVDTVDVNSNLKETDEFDFVLNATGLFSTPNIPEMYGDFKGPVVHTSQWNSSVLIEDKVVAVIGSGSSAVQVIPEISMKAKKLISYQRNPAWVIPRVNYRYSKYSKWAFKYIPFVRGIYRTLFFLLNEMNFLAFKSKLFLLGFVGHLIGSMLAKINIRIQLRSNEKLKSVVTPSYAFGCKRVCISNRYYPSLLKSNVEVVTSEVKGIIGGTGIHSGDGTVRNVDVIILATGFQVMKYLTYEIDCEAGGRRNAFKDGFMGTVYSGLPNMFFIQGPGSDTLHNTAVFAIECQCDFIVKVLKRMDEMKKRSFRLKDAEANSYTKWSEEAFRQTVWNNSCASVNSYFMANDASLSKSSTLFPQSLVSFWWKLLCVDVNQVLEFK